MDLSQLPSLLAACLSPNNEERKAAEAAYQGFKESAPEPLAAALLGFLRDASQPSHLRGLGAVLLRRLLTGFGGHMETLSPQAQATIKHTLLELVSVETDKSVRLKAVDTLAELASEVLMEEEGTWPELLPAFLQVVQSPEVAEHSKEATLEACGYMCEELPSGTLTSEQANQVRGGVG